MNNDEIIDRLHKLANPEKVIFKERKFGVITKNSLGIYHSDLSQLAKETGKNSELALQLFNSDIYEARLLCSKIFKPIDLTEELAEKWVKTFDNWEICDSFSMGVFAKSSLAIPLINKWFAREEEFEKRAAFATMAGYCMADKKAANEVFEPFFELILSAADDERNFVKKAVNWALRSIGKRNKDLRQRALQVSYELLESNNKAAIWIARDAIRELELENCRMSDYPRVIYRP
jgi:3-methyladenine DNA glycosylase AlkD